MRHANRIVASTDIHRVQMLSLLWHEVNFSSLQEARAPHSNRLQGLIIAAVAHDAIDCVEWLHAQGVRVPSVSSGQTKALRHRYEKAVFDALLRGVWPALEKVDPVELFQGMVQPEGRMTFGYGSSRTMSMFFHDICMSYQSRTSCRPALLAMVSNLALHPLIKARQQHVCGEFWTMLSMTSFLKITSKKMLHLDAETMPLLIHMFKTGLLTPKCGQSYLPSHIKIDIWEGLDQELGNRLRQAYITALGADLDESTSPVLGHQLPNPIRL